MDQQQQQQQSRAINPEFEAGRRCGLGNLRIFNMGDKLSIGAMIRCNARLALVPWLLATLSIGLPWPLRAQARASGSPAPADSGEIVRPGDLIRLKIWREPDMSGEIIVDEGGVATLPRLGPLRVADLAADSLKRMLIQSYSKYLRDPAIDVTVLRRITVLGAVRTPNVYHVEPTMTVADALALAGGAGPNGKVDEVELRRRDRGPPVRLTRGTRLADTPIRSGDELYVPQRSWFSRNAPLIFGVVGTTLSVLYFVRR